MVKVPPNEGMHMTSIKAMSPASFNLENLMVEAIPLRQRRPAAWFSITYKQVLNYL